MAFRVLNLGDCSPFSSLTKDRPLNLSCWRLDLFPALKFLTFLPSYQPGILRIIQRLAGWLASPIAAGLFFHALQAKTFG